MPDSIFIYEYLCGAYQDPNLFKWYVNVNYVHSRPCIEESLAIYIQAPHEWLKANRERVIMHIPLYGSLEDEECSY